MLKEMKDVRQIEGEGFRRWFTDDYFDLYVWYEKDEIRGFQLSYDKPEDERVLTWKAKGNYDHEKIDDGEGAKQMKMTPILKEDGIFEKEMIAEKFKSESGELEAPLSDFIYKKILDYNDYF